MREKTLADPRSFFEKFKEGAILDEIQRAPQLLSYLQVLVDEMDKKGHFILTGSHQLELQEAIAQSLAGRTALLTLYPMSLQELSDAGYHKTLNEYLLLGGYPRIFKDQLDPYKAYRNYFQTYVERDLKQLIHVKDLGQFQRFVRLIAGRIGQLLNAESLANDVGVTSHTIKHWVSVLEASYILIRLYPYYENFGKRIIKSPKIYFSDVGLASYLLGIETVSQMDRDPLRGHLVENLIFLELLKARVNKGLDPQLYFFRDTHGHEVDFIFQRGHELLPIEAKASKTFNTQFVKNIHFFQKLAPERTEKGAIIYDSPVEETFQNIQLVPYLSCGSLVTLSTAP